MRMMRPSGSPARKERPLPGYHVIALLEFGILRDVLHRDPRVRTRRDAPPATARDDGGHFARGIGYEQHAAREGPGVDDAPDHALVADHAVVAPQNPHPNRDRPSRRARCFRDRSRWDVRGDAVRRSAASFAIALAAGAAPRASRSRAFSGTQRPVFRRQRLVVHVQARCIADRTERATNAAPRRRRRRSARRRRST